MNCAQLTMLHIKLLIATAIVCAPLYPLVAGSESSISITPTDSYASLPCQPDSALNALLVQMLMAIQPYLILQQHQQQQPSWRTSSNELYTATAQPVETTVVTSSVISTMTQTVSKVISIWYRNERIPTTLYSQTTLLTTDYITVTSTLPAAVQPTERVRARRDDATQLESSIVSDDDGFERSRTLALPRISATELPLSLLKEPKIAEAWDHFLQVLAESYNHTVNNL